MEITPTAIQKLQEFAEDFDAPYPRVEQIATGGCCSAKVQLGVTLDDAAHDDDEQFVFGDLTVLVKKQFYHSIDGKLKIDFLEGQGIVVEIINDQGRFPRASS
ncbi:MAG: hypothetical protein LBC94_02825 [Desulfovibrio sp.]|nr:hypothetical protein [Desulfovibrio sp.]